MRSEAAVNVPATPHEVLAAALGALLKAVNGPVGGELPSTLRGHGQPGGARIPGTSFEATPASAAQAIAVLLQSYGDAAFVQRFAETLAQHDAASRAAPGHGHDGPLMAEVLAVCVPPSVSVPDDVAPLAALASALQLQFRPEEAQRVLACFENPQALSAMPVRDFIALLVRL